MVIATSRHPESTPELVAEIEGKGGRWLPLDVTAPSSAKIVADLEESGIAIDVLVNNAGRSLHGAIESFSEEETRSQMDVVFFGPFRLVRAVIPAMRARRTGIVVNIGSGAGIDGRETMGIYAAAKAAMDGMARVLAKEVAPFNVRILTVQLGAFDTSFGASALFSTAPLPEDYRGTGTEKLYEIMKDSATIGFPADGDHLKASQVIYEVVTGTGVGTGREGERVLPLGRDLAACWNRFAHQWEQTMDVFGHVCNDVSIEKLSS
ncbi:hypothetical protein ACHAQA_009894 [Verticillium albo-atrum]